MIHTSYNGYGPRNFIEERLIINRLVSTSDIDIDIRWRLTVTVSENKASFCFVRRNAEFNLPIERYDAILVAVSRTFSICVVSSEAPNENGIRKQVHD